MSRKADVHVARWSLSRRANERPHEVTRIGVRRSPRGPFDTEVQVAVSWTGRVRVFVGNKQVYPERGEQA